MSSSESDFKIDENSCLGYQYEPEYTEEEHNLLKMFQTTTDTGGIYKNVLSLWELRKFTINKRMFVLQRI